MGETIHSMFFTKFAIHPPGNSGLELVNPERRDEDEYEEGNTVYDGRIWTTRRREQRSSRPHHGADRGERKGDGSPQRASRRGRNGR